MPAGDIPVWKKAPFLRFLLPLMAGIILEWYAQMTLQILWGIFVFSVLLFPIPLPFANYRRYKLAIPNGIAVALLFIAIGSLLAWYKDIRHDFRWYGKHYKQGLPVIAALQEPPVEKTNSYKAVATLIAVERGDEFISTTGNVILYFKKDSTVLTLDYGSQVIFSKPLQEIKNGGNPGGFDYKRYSLFRDITHQVYLKQNEFIVLNEKKQSLFGKILFPIRREVLSILRRNIHGEKEYGLAEALLIGYKDDLDKNLVQSYTNTGVVHIIAISGMHTALIYGMLAFLCRPLKKIKYSKWFVAAIIIAGLWLFSFLAGGQPSVLRSALMFTCIAVAQNFARKTSTFNTLAFSAFILACVNPYWLWDVGFQLSYAAVLSIVVFMKPIYNWFYIKNKVLDFIWKLNAVTIAAQLLTTPFSIYHFHQFPNFFLFTNFIVVPLSGFMVLGEILLCAIAIIPFMSTLVGKFLSCLIWLMNSYIERIDSLPYSPWDGMQISVMQAALLFIAVSGFSYWLLEKQKSGAWAGILALLFFMSRRSLLFYGSDHQRKLIVYSVPKHQAIDIINGRSFLFIGDGSLLADDFVRNFHVKPSRLLHRVEPVDHFPNFVWRENFLQIGQKRILLIDRSVTFDSCAAKIPIDLLIVSKNPNLYLSKFSRTFTIKQVVCDGSVFEHKIRYWKNDCDSLHIPFWNVNEKGAFVMSLN